MKKASKAVQLVLITSVLASCSKPAPKSEEPKQQVFMRADSTAQYTNVTNQYNRTHSGNSGGNALLWFMAFRHLGGGMGYGSAGLHPKSVVGTNTNKANAYSTATKRGGFGSTASKSNVSATS